SDARAIVERGVDMGQSRIGAYGQGFYTSTTPEPFYGPAEIVVAVRLLTPLVGHLDDIEEHIDEMVDRLSLGDHRMTPELARRIRRALLDAGYDGLVIHDGGGDGVDYVIAIADGTVRVVSEA